MTWDLWVERLQSASECSLGCGQSTDEYLRFLNQILHLARLRVECKKLENYRLGKFENSRLLGKANATPIRKTESGSFGVLSSSKKVFKKNL